MSLIERPEKESQDKLDAEILAAVRKAQDRAKKENATASLKIDIASNGGVTTVILETKCRLK